MKKFETTLTPMKLNSRNEDTVVQNMKYDHSGEGSRSVATKKKSTNFGTFGRSSKIASYVEDAGSPPVSYVQDDT